MQGYNFHPPLLVSQTYIYLSKGDFLNSKLKNFTLLLSQIDTSVNQETAAIPSAPLTSKVLTRAIWSNVK